MVCRWGCGVLTAGATGMHVCACVPQVSLGALKLLQACINNCPGVLESNLEKLMPLLFLKLCAGKQSVRAAAEASLQGALVFSSNRHSNC